MKVALREKAKDTSLPTYMTFLIVEGMIVREESVSMKDGLRDRPHPLLSYFFLRELQRPYSPQQPLVTATTIIKVVIVPIL